MRPFECLIGFSATSKTLEKQVAGNLISGESRRMSRDSDEHLPSELSFHKP